MVPERPLYEIMLDWEWIKSSLLGLRSTLMSLLSQDRRPCVDGRRRGARALSRDVGKLIQAHS